MLRPEIGITTFLSAKDLKPWRAIFKHLYADFVVQEILEDETVCQFTDDEEQQTKLEEPPVDVIYPKKLSADDKEKLRNLAELKSVEDWTKDERKELHECIRKLGDFDSTTEGDVIKAKKAGGFNSRKRRAWPANQPEQLHFTLTKVFTETSYAVGLVAKFLNRNTNSFSYCGIKDRRALTAQRVSCYQLEPKELLRLNERLHGIRVLSPVLREKRLTLGELWGNRFSIILREFEAWNDPNLEKRIADWGEEGFLNYFGDQRFGSLDVLTSDIGKEILKKDYEAAVNLILKPKQFGTGVINDALRSYAEDKDPEKALSFLKGAQKHNAWEQHVLRSLKHDPKNFSNALIALPRNQRSLYVHAYQSLVFNKVASKRADQFGLKVLPGDLILEDRKPVKIENVNGHSIADIVLPLPSDPIILPDNEVGKWYEEILGEDGITLAAFEGISRDYAISESYRRFVEKPMGVEHQLLHYRDVNGQLQNIPPFAKIDDAQLCDADASDAHHALKLNFSLPSSTYATIALRELLHSDLSKHAQKLISKTI